MLMNFTLKFTSASEMRSSGRKKCPHRRHYYCLERFARRADRIGSASKSEVQGGYGTSACRQRPQLQERSPGKKGPPKLRMKSTKQR